MKVLAKNLDSGFTVEVNGQYRVSLGGNPEYINEGTLEIDIARAGMTTDEVERILQEDKQKQDTQEIENTNKERQNKLNKQNELVENAIKQVEESWAAEEKNDEYANSGEEKIEYVDNVYFDESTTAISTDNNKSNIYKNRNFFYYFLNVMGVILCFAVALFVLWLVNIYIHDEKEKLEQIRLKRKERRSALFGEAKKLIDCHAKALRLQYMKSVYKDPYGNLIKDRWSREVDYFIDNVLKKNYEISCALEEADLLNELIKSATDSLDKNYFDRIVRYKESIILSRDDLRILICDQLELMDDFGSSNLMEEDVGRMTSLQFENFCASFFNKNGWNVRVTSATGDQGIDIVAEIDKFKIVIQCKKYSTPVGNKAVQEIIAGKQYERADLAAVVSNVDFTKSAKELANAANVYLLHYSELDNFARGLKKSLI